MTFRTRALVGVWLASAIALAVAITLVSANLRRAMADEIAQGLMRQARLASELLAERPLADPDGEADRIGAMLGERVTLIADDGHVVGDSEVAKEGLGALENHAGRPEITEARDKGTGSAVRVSPTLGIMTEYAAASVRDSPVAFVRVALPLSTIDAELATTRRQALIGLVAGLMAATLLTWMFSRPLGRRLDAIAASAKHYAAGDFSRPLRDTGRDEIAVLANVLDDTARQLGARLGDMARTQARTDAMLNGMVEGIVLVDADGRLVLSNPAVRSMLRLPETLDDRHYLELVRQPDVAAQLARALTGAHPAAAEVLLDTDGQRRVFRAHTVPVAAERGGGAVLVLHDISDLKRADQVRRDFVANVSHELRTPLTAIRGYVEALADGPPPDEARKFTDIIARHALRMERLVKDLLRLARLDAGQETLDRVPCSIAALVSAVEHDLHTPLSAKQQRVVISVAPDAATVSADPAKLQDVLRNLLENASNYGPEGSAIEVGAVRADDGVSITVADRGPGIPPTDLGRIFERFYRVDRSRTRDPGGTGLGLSIVRHLVGLHGGRVSAANRDGGGSIFTMWLPLAPSDTPKTVRA